MSDSEEDLRKSEDGSHSADDEHRRGEMTTDSEEENVENTGMEEKD